MKPFIQNSSNLVNFHNYLVKRNEFFLGVSMSTQKTFYLDQDFNKLDKLVMKSKNTCNKNTLKKQMSKTCFL